MQNIEREITPEREEFLRAFWRENAELIKAVAERYDELLNRGDWESLSELTLHLYTCASLVQTELDKIRAEHSLN